MKKLLLKFFKNDPISKIVEVLNLLIDRLDRLEKIVNEKQKGNGKTT
jgi:hypothetical protein